MPSFLTLQAVDPNAPALTGDQIDWLWKHLMAERNGPNRPRPGDANFSAHRNMMLDSIIPVLGKARSLAPCSTLEEIVASI